MDIRLCSFTRRVSPQTGILLLESSTWSVPRQAPWQSIQPARRVQGGVAMGAMGEDSGQLSLLCIPGDLPASEWQWHATAGGILKGGFGPQSTDVTREVTGSTEQVMTVQG